MPNGKKEYQNYFNQLRPDELMSLLKDAGFEIIKDVPGQIFIEDEHILMEDFSLQVFTQYTDLATFQVDQAPLKNQNFDFLKVAC